MVGVVGHWAYASVNSSCDHPPPGTVWGICTLTCPHGRAFAAAYSPGHLSISGYYPQAFVAHAEKRPRPRVSFVVYQNGRLLNMLNKFYIILLNVDFQV
jgi:hypothetical protein